MIDSNTLLQAQKEDPVVGRVLAFRLDNNPPSHGLEQEINKSSTSQRVESFIY